MELYLNGLDQNEAITVYNVFYTRLKWFTKFINHSPGFAVTDLPEDQQCGRSVMPIVI